jgi:hypothetical protein
MSDQPQRDRRSIYASGLPNYSENRTRKPIQTNSQSSKITKGTNPTSAENNNKKSKTTHDNSEQIETASSTT